LPGVRRLSSRWRRFPSRPAGPKAPPAAVSDVVVKLVDGTPRSNRSRAGLLGTLGVLLAASGRRATAAGAAGGRWLSDIVEEVAPHIPIRDLASLQAHHDGLAGDDLAQALIDTASRATGAVGAAAGMVATVEFAASQPLLFTAPVQIAAETLAVIAIEVKLVAELHEVYGRAATGTPAVRAATYLGAWTGRRGADSPDAGVPTFVSIAARRQLRRRVTRRAQRNVFSLLPLMAGVVAGASLNSHETKRLGDRVKKDLRGRRWR
jgi:hypothetical protein